MEHGRSQRLGELIRRYVQGECNVGFDKLRIIFLACLGRGAGWFDDATSWSRTADRAGKVAVPGCADASSAVPPPHWGNWPQLAAALRWRTP
jgi:hypothetical protein